MQGSPIDQLRYRYNYGGAYMKVLFWTVGAFLLVELIDIIAYLSNARLGFAQFIGDWLVAETDPGQMVWKPWTVITYMFLHGGFLHILFNMFMLYFSGRLIEQTLGSKRFMFVYFVGGVFAFLMHFLAINAFPVYGGINTPVIGASGAVTAVFICLATLSPNLEAYFFGLFRIKVVWLAIAFVLLDLLRIESNDNVAHFTHLGGALFGFLYGYFYTRGTDFYDKMRLPGFRNPFKRKSKIKVVHRNKKTRDDIAYNSTKVERQKRIDAILDKIKDSGYESLSAEEKDFLFRESKNI